MTNLKPKRKNRYKIISHIKTMCTDLSPYLQFSWEETLKLLLQRESESEPAHVGGLPALPEVHYTLEVLFRLFVLLLLLSFTAFAPLLPLRLLLIVILVLHRHPVSTEAQ